MISIMTSWNNYIMKKYGVSIRIAIFNSYYNGYLKGFTLASREREEKLNQLMDKISEKDWVEC